MRFAFSKPTASEEDRQTLLTRFRAVGYHGLQLKGGQYLPYLDEPQRFLDEGGAGGGAASALITGGVLDDAGREQLRKLYAFAEAVGSERVVYVHGVVRDGLSAEDIRGFAAPFSDMGRAAADHGLKLSLHHHRNNPVMHRPDFDLFFDAVDAGTVGLTLDSAHAVVSGIDDVAELIRSFAHVIDNYHLKDLRDGAWEVLGRGEIDFAPIFEAIGATGYDGWISSDEESGAELEPAMRACLRYVRDGLGGPPA